MTEEHANVLLNAAMIGGCTQCGSLEHIFLLRTTDGQPAVQDEDDEGVGASVEDDRHDGGDEPVWMRHLPCGHETAEGECCASTVHRALRPGRATDGGKYPYTYIGGEGRWRVLIVCDVQPEEIPAGHSMLFDEKPLTANHAQYFLDLYRAQSDEL